MLLHLTDWLGQFESAFSVFRYLTLRGIMAVLTALTLSFLVGPAMIRHLTRYKISQTVRDDGPQSHLSKAGTPTMGGALILVAVGIATLLWANLANGYVWLVLLVTLACGAIGLVDDYRKLVLKDHRGLAPRHKFLGQSLVGLAAAGYLYAIAATPAETALLVPYLKEVSFQLGPWFMLLTYLVIVGSSNAVNLTDGLDGLAVLPTVLVCGALGVFVYASGRVDFATYLKIPYVPGVGEVVVFCGALVGAGLGFLWFNTYPAQVFMGDVGALALGAALGTVAVIARQLEGGYLDHHRHGLHDEDPAHNQQHYLLTGKRIFRMAPLHHHFELKGWPESRVIVRFWILTVILILVGLASLKIR